ncbi:YoaK family protein [Eremococcus coleocola]|uniref:DUF1275 domain-containing protein n=1 Tax=Eremococcus coleocola ACS-139-V-Col8 TaxID=908337 RepID=E4KQ61_9LACT|nr:YoaK family protein [Eremococcus coleocola]EFR30826.1 hypothetical protein HMPREF9257_1659 [Eremococcus coleocola ACS-139-V-Col8]
MRATNFNHILPAIILSSLAGSLDAYSYINFGKVFAGMQTGNIIILSIRIGQGAWSATPPYLLSIFMFVLGTLVTRFIQHQTRLKEKGEAGLIVLLFETVMMLLAAMLQDYVPPLVITSFFALAAAAQFQEFRSLGKHSYASTMMTGNLRNLTESFYDAVFLKDALAKNRLKYLSMVLASFVLGVLITAFLNLQLGLYSIWILVFGLFLVMLMGIRLGGLDQAGNK